MSGASVYQQGITAPDVRAPREDGARGRSQPPGRRLHLSAAPGQVVRSQRGWRSERHDQETRLADTRGPSSQQQQNTHSFQTCIGTLTKMTTFWAIKQAAQVTV